QIISTAAAPSRVSGSTKKIYAGSSRSHDKVTRAVTLKTRKSGGRPASWLAQRSYKPPEGTREGWGSIPTPSAFFQDKVRASEESVANEISNGLPFQFRCLPDLLVIRVGHTEITL